MISAYPLRTDITKHERYVGKVPNPDIACRPLKALQI